MSKVVPSKPLAQAPLSTPLAETLDPNFKSLADALANWFLHQHRPMPWRETHDPYAIWVSEVMLQQTQVVTVLAYYQRFMASFPTIEALAQAPLDSVLKHWEGLGYYGRCRRLHQAAQVIVKEHVGRFPTTYEQVLKLPGLGAYTTGAILSFAFGQRQPILDGNVKRVLSRLFNWSQPIQETASEKQLWAWATQLVEAAENPYALNQGLMELGAILCMPREAHCLLCPWQANCLAYQEGSVLQRPVTVAKKPVPHKNIGVAVICNEAGQFLIQQRPAEGLLGGLWEFPGGKQEANESIESTVTREIEEELGLNVLVGEPFQPVKHAYTHFKVTLYAFYCRLKDAEQQPQPKLGQAWAWVSQKELDHYAFPTGNKKLFAQLK